MATTNLSLLLALSTLVVGCSSSSGARQTKPLPLTGLSSYRACQTDDQCAWVTNGCCDCANGGDEIAVARDKQEAFRALFSCEDVPCTEVDVDPPCGTGEVKCEQNLCVFKPAKQP
jgi:hypothetical protein